MSTTNNILSAINAAGRLFAGYGTLTLGPIQFTGLAKPSGMPIGGLQTIFTHKLPGGGRVLDAMGPDNADIGWFGYLDGAAANATARTLDKLRQAGQVVTLAWDVFSYQVLVAEFACDTRHIPMPYRIVCVVLADNSQAPGLSLTSLALQVTADVNDGNPVAALSALSQGIVGSTVAAASTAVAAPAATTLGSAAYNTAVSAVNRAAEAINVATATVNSALAPIGVSLSSLSAAVPAALDTVAMSSQINNAAAACGDLANLLSASAFLTRAAANLQRASA